MNLGEVDASKLVHEGTHGEAQRVGLLDPTAHLSQWLLRHGLTGGKHGQCALDPGIAFVNARLVEVIECQGRLQREDVFGKIVAHQGGPDRLDAGPAVAITHRTASAPGSRLPECFLLVRHVTVASIHTLSNPAVSPQRSHCARLPSPDRASARVPSLTFNFPDFDQSAFV
ncbi:hypothetical protein [Paraburkholderia sp. MM5482-R1]|uniref:hypothetical protein n=2 Tax=Burkholderiaceae TaxID=119060 RepID=UPI003D203BF5